MPREIITVQVGQCGNQIGWRFWDLALREHAAHNPAGVFDDALSSFFRNVDTRYADPVEIPLGDGTRPISALRARRHGRHGGRRGQPAAQEPAC